jgi:2-(3-amino-3-carboxypropyl)histidine synthase
MEEKRLEQEVWSRNARLVLVQLPEGLKAHGPRLAAAIEKAGALAILSADPCYGACDLASVDANGLGVDLLVHYGHSEMTHFTPEHTPPTLYIEARADCSVSEATEEAIPLLKNWTSIGLATTIQHIHKLTEAKHVLLGAGKKVTIGDAGILKHAGQVTGCDYSNAKAALEEVDAFLFVGGGRFHALGVALATLRPTIAADPYQKKAFSLEAQAEKTVRKRYANIHETSQAKMLGILLGLKPGQSRLAKALEIKRLAEATGKKATLLALREVTPEALMQFPTIDAFVNTACPRLSLDHPEQFGKPMLLPIEFFVASQRLEWEELCQTGWFGS